MITFRFTPIITEENPFPPSEVFAPVSHRYYSVSNNNVEMSDHDGMVAKFTQPESFETINTPTHTPYSKEKYDQWVQNNKELLFASYFFQVNGFGYQAQQYVKGLEKLCNLYVLDRAKSEFEWPEGLKAILKKQMNHLPLVSLVDLTPSLPSSAIFGQFKGIYTMFETDHLDKYNVDIVNTYDFVIVPSQFSKDTFIKSGVTKPIYIVQHGVAEEDWPYTPRTKTPIFTFGLYGQLSPRKGADIAVDAFKKAFPIAQYPNVRLCIKTSYNMGFWKTDDPRIQSLHTMLSRKSLLELINSWNCLIFPTRGEGFGLPPIEAMANGLPVICTNFSGVTEYLNDKTGYPIKKVDLVKSWGYDRRDGQGNITPEGQDYGNFGQADIDETAQIMKHVYDNYDEALKKAEYAAKYVRKDFNWDNMAKKMLECVNNYLLSQIPENEKVYTNAKKPSTKTHNVQRKNTSK